MEQLISNASAKVLSRDVQVALNGHRTNVQVRHCTAVYRRATSRAVVAHYRDRTKRHQSGKNKGSGEESLKVNS